jgi:hypothetical protein
MLAAFQAKGIDGTDRDAVRVGGQYDVMFPSTSRSRLGTLFIALTLKMSSHLRAKFRNTQKRKISKEGRIERTYD